MRFKSKIEVETKRMLENQLVCGKEFRENSVGG